MDNRTDICIAMETWLNDDDKTWLECCDLSKNGLQIQSVNRKDRRGGGITLISTTNIKIILLENGENLPLNMLYGKLTLTTDQ